MRLPIAILFLTCSAGAAEAAPHSVQPNRELEGLANMFVAARLERDPDLAYRFGLPLSDRLEGQLLDRTPAKLRDFDATVDRLSTRLSRIEARRLDRRDRVLHAVLSEELAAYTGLRSCHHEWWDVSHIGGWLADLIDLAQIEPGGTPKLRKATIRRWSSLPAAVSTQIANLEDGLDHGYAAPRPAVERSIAQLDSLIDGPVEKSPFYSPALRDPDPDFAGALHAIMEGPARQALIRYRQFLKETYLPRSRATLGVSALPDGAACYRALVRRFTSSKEPIDQIFAQAEAANSEGLRDALDAGAEHYGTRDLAQLLMRARSDPAERYASPAEILQDSRDTAARARKAFTPLFETMPKQAIAVEPYPAGQRGLGLPPRYMPSGTLSVPAVTWVPDERFASMPRGLMRSTILHEGIPGHHMIGARMAARPGHPLLRLAYQAAFDEGWAVYSEGLAEEAGLPRTPGGRVIAGINRAKSAIMDIGINGLGWDKAEVERQLAQRGGLGQQADDRIARIAAFPAQQLSYTAGELTILSLRAEAQRRLGSRFSLAAFHEVVLRDGWVPLWFLRENVEAWIGERERQK